MAEKESEKVKTKPNKLIILIVIMSMVMMLGAVAIVFMATDISLTDVMAKFQKHEEYVMPLESFVVNLDTEAKKNIYLKTQISLLYTDDKMGKILEQKSSQIRDVIIKSLMEYKSEDLLVDGGLSSAKVKLRADINAALGDDLVKEIYFTDFLIQ